MTVIARYPEGHELAGQNIERTQQCPRCGKDFTQERLDAEWLNNTFADAPKHIDLLLKNCEVEVVDGKKHVWSPARCITFTRASLNTEVGPSTSHLRIVP